MTNKISIITAVNQAIHDSMNQDDDVVILGEDIGTNGGVFRATSGLKESFGHRRVMDTPIAEGMIAGAAIGMSSYGLRPIAEFQFSGFMFPAMEQIICQAARLRNRTRGRITCPLVFRAPYGGGIHAPEHHSESIEALFAHVPGLRVVIPSDPQKAYSLLRASIESNDPVIFLEPKRVYHSSTGEVDFDMKMPVDCCFKVRDGNDITLVTWGAMMDETIKVADVLLNQNIKAEIIDVACINPLDTSLIEESVKKTHKCVIVAEATRSGGVASEISARVSEQCILDIHAPVKRITGYDITMPFFKNESKQLPSVKRILNGIKETIEYTV